MIADRAVGEFEPEMDALVTHAAVRELLYVGGWIGLRELHARFMREAVLPIDGVPGLVYRGVIRVSSRAESGGLLFL